MENTKDQLCLLKPELQLQFSAVPITGIFVANKWEKCANNWNFLMFYSEFFAS
jgi:hypothetical protein